MYLCYYPKVCSFLHAIIQAKEGDNLILSLQRMYDLAGLYEQNPQSKKINLQFKNLKDITQMMPLLAKFRNLSEISFHGNRLTFIPPLDTMKNLKAIDLSNNPIKIDKILLDRLYQIEKLETLYIDCSHSEREWIVENLPDLKQLNGELIQREKFIRQILHEELKLLDAKMSEEIKRTRETYSKLVASLQVPELSSKIQKSSRLARDQEFNMIQKDIQQQMAYFYSGLQDKLSREGVFAYCKNKLTSTFDNLMIKILDEVANEAVVKIYEEITKIKSQNFDLLLRIIFNASYQKYIGDQVQKPENKLRKQTIYQNQIFRLKKQVADIKKQQDKFDRITEKEQSTIEKAISPKNKSPTPKSIQRSSSANKFPRHSPSAKVLPKTSTLSRSPSARTTNKGSNINKQNTARNVKILSLQHLTKLIEEIMNEKRKFNLRSLSKNQVFQTSEEFIFTFFSRRYGLKDVALDWSLTLIKSIENYCKESIQVEIFGKILKNILYEQYYDQFKQFGKEIDKVCKQSRLQKGTSQTAFRKLFFYFFSYQNEDTFYKIIKSFTFSISKPDLTYFLQSYKLAFEQKCLAPFLQLFSSHDRDDDSALNSKQTKQLINALIRLKKDLSQQQIIEKKNDFWSIIDTFKKNKFIFSQVFQIAHKLL